MELVAPVNRFLSAGLAVARAGRVAEQHLRIRPRLIRRPRDPSRVVSERVAAKADGASWPAKKPLSRAVRSESQSSGTGGDWELLSANGLLSSSLALHEWVASIIYSARRVHHHAKTARDQGARVLFRLGRSWMSACDAALSPHYLKPPRKFQIGTRALLYTVRAPARANRTPSLSLP